MDLRATLCPDRLLPWVPSIFYRPRSLTALLIAAHLKIHAEHNWSETGAPPPDLPVDGSVMRSEATPVAGPFPAQVHPRRGSSSRSICDRAAARAGWAGICRSQREDCRGLYRLRYAGNKGVAENAHDAGG